MGYRAMKSHAVVISHSNEFEESNGPSRRPVGLHHDVEVVAALSRFDGNFASDSNGLLVGIAAENENLFAVGVGSIGLDEVRTSVVGVGEFVGYKGLGVVGSSSRWKGGFVALE